MHNWQVWRERRTGLRRWFVNTGFEPPQAELLRSKARATIPQWLAAVAALNERRSGRSDRSVDFRLLAGWFAATTNDDDSHRLARRVRVKSGTTFVDDYAARRGHARASSKHAVRGCTATAHSSATARIRRGHATRRAATGASARRRTPPTWPRNFASNTLRSRRRASDWRQGS